MKNKRAFTLMELLAVIVIVAILLILAIPQVMRIIKKGTNNYYRSMENSMSTAGMDYMETYRSLLPREKGNVAIIYLDELMDNNYIDKVKDEKGNLCEGQVAVEKTKKDGYKYHSCLICGDYYHSEEKECNYSEENNYYADSEDYEIVVEKDYYRVNQLEEFISPYAKVLKNGEVIKENLRGKPRKLNTNSLGSYEVVYFYHGATKKITVDVIDVTKPSETKVVLKYVKANGTIGSNYKGNWYSGNIYAEYKATDYTKKGLAGSGIDHYESSDDGIEYTRVNGNSEVMSREGNYVRYVVAVDKNGNRSMPKKYRIKIDKTKPTCSLEVKSGTPYTNKWNVLWYNTDISVGYKATDGTYSNIRLKPISYTMNNKLTRDSESVSVTKPIEGLVITGTVTDDAGNINTCSIKVNVDNVKPTLTINATTSIQDVTNKAARDYFTQWFSISKEESIVCHLLDQTGENVVKTITNVNELQLGRNYVSCTSTSGSGLKATTKTQFKHWYYGKVHCGDGNVKGENHSTGAGYCEVYHANCDKCGCDRWPECQGSCCGVDHYESSRRAACGVESYNSCAAAACGTNYTQSCSSTTLHTSANCNGSWSPNGNGDGGTCTVCGPVASGYKTCEDSSCGVNRYNSCEDPSKPVYNTCRGSCCGSCEVCTSCHYEDNSTRSYSCHLTATAPGTTGKGTLSGKKCSF